MGYVVCLDNVEFRLLEAALPGDANADGQVGFDDFLILSGNFGQQVDGAFLDGDFDADGTVSFADFLILSANFSAVARPLMAATPSLQSVAGDKVPEIDDARDVDQIDEVFGSLSNGMLHGPME